MRVIYALAFSLPFLMQTGVHASGDSLLLKAVELLQSDQKSQALKLLEKAVDTAKDPETVKEAAALLIQAAPDNYPKRDSYLQYLVRNYREHEDLWKWFREIGDRAFAKARFQEAEEAYLQAQTHSPQPKLLTYKLAWTLWNEKRRNEAFSLFLDLTIDESPELVSLRSAIIRDLSKLWWEVGVLPVSTFQRLVALPEESRQSLVDEVFLNFPKAEKPEPRWREMLKQIRSEATMAASWQSFTKAEHLFFKKSPCHLIEEVFQTPDIASQTQLLACMKSEPRPGSEVLERHFLAHLQQADENFMRAFVSLLSDSKRNSEALRHLLEFRFFHEASTEYYKLIAQFLGSLSQTEFVSIVQVTAPEKLELVLEKSSDSSLLEKLQAAQPRVWLAYEEKRFGDQPPRSFLIKKANYLLDDASSSPDEIQEISTLLLEQASGREEKLTQGIFSRFDQHQTRELPRIFDEEFVKALNLWIADVDRDIDAFQKLPEDFKRIFASELRLKIRATAERLQAELTLVALPEESQELEAEFLNRKVELKDQIAKKYESLIGQGG